MTIYKVTYESNGVTYCEEMSGSKVVTGLYQFEHAEGMIAYAMIKADTIENAVTIGRFIVAEVLLSPPGYDEMN